jgi:hypothetical protein
VSGGKSSPPSAPPLSALPLFSERSRDLRRGRRPRRRPRPRRPLDFSPSPAGCMSGDSGTSQPMWPERRRRGANAPALPPLEESPGSELERERSGQLAKGAAGLRRLQRRRTDDWNLRPFPSSGQGTRPRRTSRSSRPFPPPRQARPQENDSSLIRQRAARVSPLPRRTCPGVSSGVSPATDTLGSADGTGSP